MELICEAENGFIQLLGEISGRKMVFMNLISITEFIVGKNKSHFF